MWWKKSKEFLEATRVRTDEEVKIAYEEWLQDLKDGEGERKEKIEQYTLDLLTNDWTDRTKDYFRLRIEKEELEDLQERLERERESPEDKQKREDDNKRRWSEQKPIVWTSEEKRQMADEDKQRRRKDRVHTFLTLGVILGFVFLMSLCDSGRNRSYDDPDERIPVPRARR